MTRTQWYIAGGVAALFVIGMALQWAAPDPIDWTLSLETDDTRPFGSQVPYDVMHALFPETNVTVRERSPYPLLRDGDASTPTLAIVTQHYAPGQAETNALFNYVEQGGTVFLSAMEIGRHVRDSLRIEMGPVGLVDSLALVNPTLQSGEAQPFKRAWGAHLTAVDTARTAVLGTGTYQPLAAEIPSMNPNVLPDLPALEEARSVTTFIRWEHGDGTLLLHTVPTAFTNYAAVEDGAWSYLYGVFSYLPERSIQWAAYYAPTRAAAETPFRYLIMNPSLRTALYLLLGLVFLFLLDGLRRRQRMVPVIKPPENATRSFVETVGRFYKRHGSHAALAHNMKQHFAATVHRHYGITPDLNADDFAERLAQRSGAPLNTVQTAITALRRVGDAQASWSDRNLVTLRHHLDAFYHAATGLHAQQTHGTDGYAA